MDCTSGIERFVYAGDNVLWEMRGPGSSSSTVAELDQAIGTGQEYGAIGYTHAGGVDRPLAAYKRAVNAAVIAPHTNWRGQFSGGTYLLGSQSTAPVSWPGYSTTAWYQGKPPQEQNRVYMGTVLEGQRDASGQMYMRNRMYDPATGQFTQTDPIGIAGGLNTYGFAAGDPVSYSDPYGLCPICVGVAAAWAVLEIAGSAYDAYTAGKTTLDFARGRASGGELAGSYGGFALGIVAPGGGYGLIGRELVDGMVNPRSVRFTQNSISGSFKDGSGTVRDLAEGLEIRRN